MGQNTRCRMCNYRACEHMSEIERAQNLKILQTNTSPSGNLELQRGVEYLLGWVYIWVWVQNTLSQTLQSSSRLVSRSGRSIILLWVRQKLARKWYHIKLSTTLVYHTLDSNPILNSLHLQILLSINWSAQIY